MTPHSPGDRSSPAVVACARIERGPWLASLSLALFWVVVPRMRYDGLGVVLASSIVSLATVLWLATEVGSALRRPRHIALAAVCCLVASLAGWLGVIVVGGAGANGVGWAVLPLRQVVFVWFASTVGVITASIVRSANLLPPIAVVLALVDVWTVRLGGPVQRVMESQAPLAKSITSAMTMPLAPPRGATPIVVIGFADIMFAAFFVAALSRHAPGMYRRGRALMALIGTLCIYMAFVSQSGIAMPALVPMAVLMVVLHRKAFAYERSELFALLYAGLVVSLAAAAFWWLGRVG